MVKIRKNPTKTFFKVFGTVFMIIGVFFILMGVFATIRKNDIEKNYVPARAKVIDFQSKVVMRKSTSAHSGTRRENKPTKETKTLIEYTVDGKKYTKLVSAYSTKWKIGDEILISYLPKDPNKIAINSMIAISILIPLFIGIIFFLIGFIFLAIQIAKGAKERRLKELGNEYEGEIVDVTLNKLIRMNRRHPYKIKCTCRMNDGTIREFTRNDVFTNDPNGLIGRGVHIFVDPENLDSYFIDLASFDEDYHLN